jgi:hypothetical protein
LAARRIAFIFLLNTPQCAFACGVFLWFAVALILSFCSSFLLKSVFDRH